jgi:hypothetical protein
VTHRDTAPMTRHLLSAHHRRLERPLIFHSNRGGTMCPGHRTRRAALLAEQRPGAGPIDVCLRVRLEHPALTVRWWMLVPNHSFVAPRSTP